MERVLVAGRQARPGLLHLTPPHSAKVPDRAPHHRSGEPRLELREAGCPVLAEAGPNHADPALVDAGYAAEPVKGGGPGNLVVVPVHHAPRDGLADARS